MPEPVNLPQLPPAFYESHPNLGHVFQAAQARRAAPDVALLAVLGRVATLAPLGAMVNGSSLNVVGAFVGRSGSGKTQGYRVARELVPDVGTDADGVGISSGEGVIERYMGKVTEHVDGRKEQHKQQVRTAALFHVDEGETLLTVSRREGSTTLATLRSAWAGETLGTSGANADTTRHLRHGAYRFVLLVGLQPEYAGQLFDIAHDGTPQRFVWVAAGDAHADNYRPSFPGPLELTPWPNRPITVDSHVAGIVDRQQVANLRNGGAADEHETHTVQNQLRIAALFGFIVGDPGQVTPETWTLAGQLIDVGRSIRHALTAHARQLERERDTEKAVRNVDRREIEQAEADRRRAQRVGQNLTKIARRNGDGPHTRSQLERGLNSRDRQKELVTDALAFAVRTGLLSAVGPDTYRVGPNGPAVWTRGRVDIVDTC